VVWVNAADLAHRVVQAVRVVVVQAVHRADRAHQALHLRLAPLHFLRRQQHPRHFRDFTFTCSTGKRSIRHPNHPRHRLEVSADSVRLPLHPQRPLLHLAGSNK
jgi:hypothetical protein